MMIQSLVSGISAVTAGAALIWKGWGLPYTAPEYLSPVLYELFRRIPFIRWCIFGE